MLCRSPEMMNADTTALMVIDVQEKLVRAMPEAETLVWNVGRLVDGAAALGVRVVATEQYPDGLGPTVSEVAKRLKAANALDPVEKKRFSGLGCEALFAWLRSEGVIDILLCGIESHVCVLQTALDLVADGWRVQVAVDGVASRFEVDRRTALGRMEASGVTLTTVEAALFELCETAESPAFKTISRLARSTPS